MRYYVFGAEQLTKKEIKMLKQAGIIRRKVSRFAQMTEGEEQDESKELLM